MQNIMIFLSLILLFHVYPRVLPFNSEIKLSSNRALKGNFVMKLSPRRELFFEIIESGLRDRFPDPAKVERVFRFCDYAKGVSKIPSPTEKMHEPCEEYVENLRAMAWWDTTCFPWVQPLEQCAPTIREELHYVLKQQEELFKGDSRYMGTMGTGWTAFRLQRLGEWNLTNTAMFPKTTDIIQHLDIPLAVRGVMIARQKPKSGVQPHSDGRNFILTCHLGLEIPPDCSITVAGEKRNWIQDGAIIFDTSFVHETFNGSDNDRYVLIIDFWHPDLSREEQIALEYIYDARNKFESGNAKSIDCSYINNGGTIDADEYIRAKQSPKNVFQIFNLFKS